MKINVYLSTPLSLEMKLFLNSAACLLQECWHCEQIDCLRWFDTFWFLLRKISVNPIRREGEGLSRECKRSNHFTILIMLVPRPRSSSHSYCHKTWSLIPALLGITSKSLLLQPPPSSSWHWLRNQDNTGQLPSPWAKQERDLILCFLR